MADDDVTLFAKLKSVDHFTPRLAASIGPILSHLSVTQRSSAANEGPTSMGAVSPDE